MNLITKIGLKNSSILTKKFFVQNYIMLTVKNWFILKIFFPVIIRLKPAKAMSSRHWKQFYIAFCKHQAIGMRFLWRLILAGTLIPLQPLPEGLPEYIMALMKSHQNGYLKSARLTKKFSKDVMISKGSVLLTNHH